jgi:hypothetical protein
MLLHYIALPIDFYPGRRVFLNQIESKNKHYSTFIRIQIMNSLEEGSIIILPSMLSFTYTTHDNVFLPLLLPLLFFVFLLLLIPSLSSLQSEELAQLLQLLLLWLPLASHVPLPLFLLQRLQYP